jgi:hypothetical protein
MFKGKVKAILFTKHDQQLEVVEGAGWPSGFPSASYINHQAAVIPQDSPEPLGEGSKPIAVGISIFISV